MNEIVLRGLKGVVEEVAKGVEDAAKQIEGDK
jgi:hypothetical protein